MWWRSESTPRAVVPSCWTYSPTRWRRASTWRASPWNSRAFASSKLFARTFRRSWCPCRTAPAVSGGRWRRRVSSAWCPSPIRTPWSLPAVSWNANSACPDRWPTLWRLSTKTDRKRSGWPNTPRTTWRAIWSHSKSVSPRRANTAWTFTRAKSIRWETAAATTPSRATRSTCWLIAVNIWSTLRSATKFKVSDWTLERLNQQLAINFF